jgi:hypothetical protein
MPETKDGAEKRKITKVKGKEISLPGGRCVFVAHRPGHYNIELRSKEGSITRFSLSEEAVHALAVLAPTPADHEFTVKKAARGEIEPRWQLSPPQEA